MAYLSDKAYSMSCGKQREGSRVHEDDGIDFNDIEEGLKNLSFALFVVVRRVNVKHTQVCRIQLHVLNKDVLPHLLHLLHARYQAVLNRLLQVDHVLVLGKGLLERSAEVFFDFGVDGVILIFKFGSSAQSVDNQAGHVLAGDANLASIGTIINDNNVVLVDGALVLSPAVDFLLFFGDVLLLLISHNKCRTNMCSWFSGMILPLPSSEPTTSSTSLSTPRSKWSSPHQYDIKNKKTFLKRCSYPGLALDQFFLGATLNVFSRQLKITEFADQLTRRKFERGRTFAMIKPDSYMNMGKILTIIEHSGFKISNLKMTKLQTSQAQEFYSEHRGKPFFSELVNFICSDLVLALQLISDNAVLKWRQILGTTDPEAARKKGQNSIRALFGQKGVRNAAHGSDSNTSAQRQINFFFGPSSKIRSKALFNSCSCCVIKPHLLVQGKAGLVVDRILTQGFEISAMQLFSLDRTTAQQFLQVYKGVVPEFKKMADEFCCGPCIALQVRQENVVEKLRQLAGPHDPEICRQLGKSCLRGELGTDKLRNGVHVTDLAEDGVLEVQYFFNILQK